MDMIYNGIIGFNFKNGIRTVLFSKWKLIVNEFIDPIENEGFINYCQANIDGKGVFQVEDDIELQKLKEMLDIIHVHYEKEVDVSLEQEQKNWLQNMETCTSVDKVASCLEKQTEFEIEKQADLEAIANATDIEELKNYLTEKVTSRTLTSEGGIL